MCTSRIAWLVVLLAAGCTRDALSPPTADPPDAAVLAPPDLASPAPSACAPWDADRTQANLDEFGRLGLLLSQARVEGRVGAAAPAWNGDGFLAPLDIDKIDFGPSFLAGTRVFIHLDAVEAAITPPGPYIVGFTGNPYPIKDDRGNVVWWSHQALVPAARRAAVEDLLGYRPEQVPAIAVVEISAQDADRTTLRAIRTLAGRIPGEIHVNWTRSVYAAPFPAPGPTRYIAGFSYVEWNEPSKLYLGSLVDLRPETDESSALVNDALLHPPAPLDSKGLLAFGREYRDSWAFHRSRSVLATKVSGLSEECCTNLGGTYVAHDFVSALKHAGAPPDRLLLGGHGYFAKERCGDPFLLGLTDLVPMALGPDSLSCDPWKGMAGVNVPTSRLRIAVPDDPAARTRVNGWIAAREPLLRVHPANDTPDPAALDGDAPWSALLPVDRALAAGSLIAVHVLDAAEAPGGAHVVTLETTFSPYWYDHLKRYRVKLVFACGDPRLLRKDATWLVPMVADRDWQPGDDAAIRAAGLFLVPGVLLPGTGTALRTESAFGTALR